MCGIIGVYLNKVTSEQLSQLIELFVQSGIRGVHATGISFEQNGKIKTISHHESAADFREKEQLGEFVNAEGDLHFIAHTRYSTSDLRYNQPIGDTHTSIVHNGVISQDPKKTWKKTFGLETVTSNDSELIYQCIKRGVHPLDGFEGSMAVCTLQENYLTAFRNGERPLWYSLQRNGIVFASTKNILLRSGFKHPIRCVMYNVYSFDGELKIELKEIPQGVFDLQ